MEITYENQEDTESVENLTHAEQIDDKLKIQNRDETDYVETVPSATLTKVKDCRRVGVETSEEIQHNDIPRKHRVMLNKTRDDALFVGPVSVAEKRGNSVYIEMMLSDFTLELTGELRAAYDFKKT